jgi:hypothetical protein
MRIRLYLYLRNAYSPIHSRLCIITLVIYSRRPLRQRLSTRRALHATRPFQLQILATTAAQTLMMADMHLIRNEDMTPIRDNGRPENRHGSAHDGEVDFEARDYEDFWVPPCEVEGLGCALAVFEDGPEAEDGH